jgi:hypothetical protein
LNYLLEIYFDLSVPLKTADKLERELNAFTTAIQEAAWNSTPVIKLKLKVLNFRKEIKNLEPKSANLEENGNSQEIHMTNIS